ncbi:MAG: hypothetical protein II649_11325 [Kiritimatiellae bacterium]|nr:hypothetical protein [Kiritimatiellia bacterium]
MNKAVHALVYVILAVAGVALYFEINLYDKKELLKESNSQLRDCIVKLSSYVEAEDAKDDASGDVPEAKKDDSPIEAQEVDDIAWDNLLKDYPAKFERDGQKLLRWGSKESGQLRRLYFLDSEGNRVRDAANPDKYQTTGKNTAQDLIEVVQNRASKQLENLNATREELRKMRTRLQDLVAEYNKLPPQLRRAKLDVEQKNKEIETLSKGKEELQGQLKKSKSENDELKAEVTSLKDEVASAKDETESVKEDLEKERKKVANLTNLLKTQTASAPKSAAPNSAVKGAMSSGDKGKIARVEASFVVIAFEKAVLDELLGADRNGVLPMLEMLVCRDEKGKDGKNKRKIVGKLRLRQWTPNSDFVTADVLPDWLQTPIKEGDVVIPD